MSNVQCDLSLEVTRHDGAAHLNRTLFLPRVPVSGDWVLTVDRGEYTDKVHSVTLCPETDEFSSSAWVELKSDVNTDFDNYDTDEFWNCETRQGIQEAIRAYIDGGWKASIQSVMWEYGLWMEPHCSMPNLLPAVKENVA